MRITILLGQRKIDPESVPEVMAAWDEYCIEENPEGWDDECEKAKRSWGDDLLAYRLVDLIVPDEKLLALFEVPSIEAEIETVPQESLVKYDCCGDPKPTRVDGCLMCDSCGSPLEDVG